MINCYIYVLDTLADWEIAYLTSELNSRRFLIKTKEINLITIGKTPDPITTMGGIKIIPETTIEKADFKEGDFLIIPGSDKWLSGEHHEIIELTEKLIDKNVNIAAICAATAALANRGILNNRKHTSGGKDFLKIFCPNYKGDDNYVEKAAVADRNLITATGLAPVDFTYEILRKMEVMKPEVLENWYQLYTTKEEKYFMSLMKALQ